MTFLLRECVLPVFELPALVIIYFQNFTMDNSNVILCADLTEKTLCGTESLTIASAPTVAPYCRL